MMSDRCPTWACVRYAGPSFAALLSCPSMPPANAVSEVSVILTKGSVTRTNMR